MQNKIRHRGAGSVPVRHELLKLEGVEVEIKTNLNPRAKRLIVKVHPASGEVSVTAPSRRALDKAVAFARGQSGWIADQLARIPHRVPLSVDSSVPLRGTLYRIARAEKLRVAVQIGAEPPTLYVGGAPEHTARRIVDFLKREARRDFDARVRVYAEKLGVRPSRITLRDTQSRWGSCSTTRALSFCWRLVMAPPFVLDYVAAHETVHLREMNHGPRFWALLRGLIADTDAAQDWLREHGAALHRYTP